MSLAEDFAAFYEKWKNAGPARPLPRQRTRVQAECRPWRAGQNTCFIRVAQVWRRDGLWGELAVEFYANISQLPIPERLRWRDGRARLGGRARLPGVYAVNRTPPRTKELRQRHRRARTVARRAFRRLYAWTHPDLEREMASAAALAAFSS